MRTNTTTKNFWYGGGYTTATGGDFNFGNSCVLDALQFDQKNLSKATFAKESCVKFGKMKTHFLGDAS